MNLPIAVAHQGWDEALLVGVAILIYLGLRWRDRRAEAADEDGQDGLGGEGGGDGPDEPVERRQPPP